MPRSKGETDRRPTQPEVVQTDAVGVPFPAAEVVLEGGVCGRWREEEYEGVRYGAATGSRGTEEDWRSMKGGVSGTRGEGQRRDHVGRSMMEGGSWSGDWGEN